MLLIGRAPKSGSQESSGSGSCLVGEEQAGGYLQGKRCSDGISYLCGSGPMYCVNKLLSKSNCIIPVSKVLVPAHLCLLLQHDCDATTSHTRHLHDPRPLVQRPCSFSVRQR